MARTIGVLVTRYIWVGIVDGTTLGGVRMFPQPGPESFELRGMPTGEILRHIRTLASELLEGEPVDSVGAGFPGIVRNGVIEESPNLGQLKGMAIRDELSSCLREIGVDVPVCAMNDADALASGIAATRGRLESLLRVWYLGDGIGFGRHPHGEGVFEAGHMVVTLDPKERYCGCGGVGHLEGIMGNRSMRLRFLDVEPEEIFAEALHNEPRAVEFVNLWHRALAAATATNIHLEGAGRFYLAGPNADFVDLQLLNRILQDMVKMTPLQGSFFEIVPTSHDLALIGAAVNSRMERR